MRLPTLVTRSPFLSAPSRSRPLKGRQRENVKETEDDGTKHSWYRLLNGMSELSKESKPSPSNASTSRFFRLVRKLHRKKTAGRCASRSFQMGARSSMSADHSSVKKKPLKLSRDLGKVPVDRYRLPKDGRKWKAVARERMALAEWLAIHGNGDGSRISPAEKSMTRHFGWSRRKTFYLLDDLKELHLLECEPDGRRGALTGEHGTRVRRMLPSFFRPEVQDSGSKVQDSPTLPGAEVQDSRPEMQSNVAHNRHLTDTADRDFGIESLKGKKEIISSSSSDKPDDDDSALHPDWNSIERKTGEHIEAARSALVSKGFPAHVVDAGLQMIEERSDYSGSVPSSAEYFITAFNRAMADDRDKAQISKRAKRRERCNLSLPEIQRSAAELDRESQISGRPIKDIMEIRAKAQ